MATPSDLEAAIDAVLNHGLGIQQFQANRSIAGKVYEAYVFALCLRAIRELSNSLALHGINSGQLDQSTPFVFRGGPGQIHSTTRDYGYARFSLGDEDYEVHSGIEFKGNSDMTHEVDVCILRASEAQKCRNWNSFDDPRALSLVGGWECKFHQSRLRKETGRTFVGLISDMGKNVRISGLCSNADHRQLRWYFKARGRPDFHLGVALLR